MQAPPGVDSDTSGESVSSIEDTSPRPKIYRRFNWRHFHTSPDPPTPAPDMPKDISPVEGKEKLGAKGMMKKTVKFLMEGPDTPGDIMADKPKDAGDGGGEGESSKSPEGEGEEASPAEDAGRAEAKKSPSSAAGAAMLAALRSFVAQDMVERRDPNRQPRLDPRRSPLGVPLSRRKKETTEKVSPSPAETEPASPTSPTATSGEGTGTAQGAPASPMMNPFSAPTSPVGPNGQMGYYGYGWPPHPYYPMHAGPNMAHQQDGQVPQGYMPPPFYPHPAMLQPWYPGQPRPPDQSGGRDEMSTVTGKNYLPPHLASRLNALHMSNMQRRTSAATPRADAPVRISRSRRSRDGSSPAASTGSAGSKSGMSNAAAAGDGGGAVIKAAEKVVDKSGSDKQWTKVLICLATSLDIIWRLCQAHQRKHGDESMATLCASLAKQIGAKRSMSQAVVEVFGDEAAGHELSKNLKMGVSYIARSEMLKRDPERLQEMIAGFLPKSESSIGSWLNPKIAQVVVITVQKWIDKQLDVGTALQATRQVREEARRSGVPEGAGTGLLDHLSDSLRAQFHGPPPVPAKDPTHERIRDRSTSSTSTKSRKPADPARPPSGEMSSQSRSAVPKPKATHPSGPKVQPEGLVEMSPRGVVQPVQTGGSSSAGHPESGHARSATPAPARVKRVPVPISTPAPEPPSPVSTISPASASLSMSSESRYSTSDSTPLDSPGTIDSDTEADVLLSMADSGPAALHVDRGQELLREEEEEKRKRKHKPNKEEVKEAKALLAEK